MSERYHKAARDGYLDVLKDTTRKDCNTGDEDGMTPTLWAAFEGNLEALSLLVGRGGDPDKCDHYGNTALHLASARGHMECVTFLVSFGVNLFSLDIDSHTPQELAAMNECADILRYLDSVAAKQELENAKKVKSMQEKAQKESQKLMKNFKKIQKKADKMAHKEEKMLDREIRKMEISEPKVSATNDLAPAQSGADESGGEQTHHHHSSAPKFSEMVGSSVSGNAFYSHGGGGGYSKGGTGSKKLMGTVSKMVSLKKSQISERPTKAAKDSSCSGDGSFTVRDVEDGKKSVRKLTGLRRDSEIMFVAPKINADNQVLAPPDMVRSRSISAGMVGQGIFDRPGFGSVAFRNSVSASLFSFQNKNAESIGSGGSAADEDDDEDEEEDSSSSEFAPIAVFLAGLGMSEWISAFAREKIDLNSLTLLEENDLRDMGVPTGPRKKIMKAIDDRRRDMVADATLEDSHL